MKSNNKITIDLDMEKLLGLTEPKPNTLEYDINYVMENGIDKYLLEQQKHEELKALFMSLFRECFDEIIHVFQADPKQQIAVSCAGCRYANRTKICYGKPITNRTKTNGYSK